VRPMKLLGHELSRGQVGNPEKQGKPRGSNQFHWGHSEIQALKAQFWCRKKNSVFIPVGGGWARVGDLGFWAGKAGGVMSMGEGTEKRS